MLLHKFRKMKLIIAFSLLISFSLIPATLWASPDTNAPGSTVLQKSAVMEINMYMSQMDPAEIAATLKLFRSMVVVKSQYVGNATGENLMTGAVKGLVNSLGDPYSVYMDPKMYKELMLETKGSFGGVGIVLGVKEKMLTVVAPIESTPAEAAGILSGDQILRIDAQDTKDMPIDEAVGKIRGPEGSQVKLLIQRAGQEPKEYLLTRATIQLKTVSGKILEEDIGYIRLSMFSETTGTDFIQKLQELKSQGMKALILDLRNNPGGLIGESVKVAGQLVPKGPVVSVINKDGARETLTSSLETPVGPLVVLINGGSASASEIVAGAVQDTNTGKLVGVKTFGKGSVQRVVPLDSDSAVKVTIAQYHTPKDRSIHGIGIEPDFVVEMPKDADTKADPQLDKALEVIKTLK